MKARILTTTVAAIALTATGALAQGMDRDRQDRGQQQAQDRSFQNQQRRAAQDISANELGAGQIMRIQRALGRAGFDVGPIDGNWGASTRSALASFQEYNGLDDSGELNRETLRELGVEIRPRRQISAQDLDSDEIEDIQVALGEQGFDVGPIDGNWGRSTRDAIENFQAERGLRVTGELSRETIDELGVDIQAARGAQQRNAQQNRRQASAQSDRQLERQSRQAQFGNQRGQAFGETDQAEQRQRTGQMNRQQQFAQNDEQWERQGRQAQAANQRDRQSDRQDRQARFDDERQLRAGQTDQMNRQQRFSEDRQAGQQQRNPAQSTQQANVFVQQDLIGSALRSQDGERIGEVVDLSLNHRNGMINEVVVERDDGSMIAVPYDQLRQNRQNNRLTTRMSAQELRNMEEFSYEDTVGFGNSPEEDRFDL